MERKTLILRKSHTVMGIPPPPPPKSPSSSGSASPDGAKPLEGKALVASIKHKVAADVKTMKDKGRHVCLAAIQVGQNADSQSYLDRQKKDCEALGIDFKLELLADTTTQEELIHTLEKLNHNPHVHGIILQMPLPKHIDAQDARRRIDLYKDAEGVNPFNLGMILYDITACAPCTAIAAFELMRTTGVELSGKEAVVVGASQTVGRPLALMLIAHQCTVTVCNIATKDLAAHTSKADLLFVAAGKPGLIKRGMIKPGAIVVDIGFTNVQLTDKDGLPLLDDKTGKAKTKVYGDVDYEAALETASWVTPVPGGVGRVTVMALLRNVVESAKNMQMVLPTLKRRSHTSIILPI